MRSRVWGYLALLALIGVILAIVLGHYFKLDVGKALKEVDPPAVSAVGKITPLTDNTPGRSVPQGSLATVVHEGDEYVVLFNPMTGGLGGIVHKPRCKFCAERVAAERARVAKLDQEYDEWERGQEAKR